MAPSWRRRSASSASAAVSILSSARNAGIAEREPLALDHADHAFAGRRVEAAHRARGRSCARPRRRRSPRPADARCRVRRWRQSAAPAPRRSPPPERSATTFGLPSVSVPVLSITSVSTFSMRSSASAFLISTPACAPRPTPTMIDIGVAKPERAGAGDDQHAHRGDEAEGKARLRPERRPGGEGDQRHRDHRRHEPAGDLVGQALDRRAAALRLRHHLHDLGQQRVAADLVGAHHEAAALVERAADDARILVLGHRHGFAGHHRFIERGAALEHDAVDRHLVAGPHAQACRRPRRRRAGFPRRCRRP